MSTTRSKQYFANKKTQPMQNKQEVQQSNDNKIDQDYPGFPNGQSNENIINPTTATDKKVADVKNMDGEKRPQRKPATDELNSDGSGGAFEATEEVKE